MIMCGHFPEGVETFEQLELDEQESRGEWYLRQMLGSADISGSPLLHLMTGNLSHQIEHHCFPDLPSTRYAEIAPHMGTSSSATASPPHRPWSRRSPPRGTAWCGSRCPTGGGGDHWPTPRQLPGSLARTPSAASPPPPEPQIALTMASQRWPSGSVNVPV